MKVAYIFFQTCLWIRLRRENIVSVGLLGPPLLAGDARNGGCLLTPVSFAISKHAVCRGKNMGGYLSRAVPGC